MTPVTEHTLIRSAEVTTPDTHYKYARVELEPDSVTVMDRRRRHVLATFPGPVERDAGPSPVWHAGPVTISGDCGCGGTKVERIA